MNKRFIILTLVFLFSIYFSCRQAEEVTEDFGVKALTAEDVAAIEAMGAAIDEAGLAGDWDAFAAMFAEDLVMMPPNMPALEGRDAWLEWIRTMGVNMTESQYKFEKIEGYGDLAYAVATYTETFSVAGVEDPIYDEGKILSILRKQADGAWRFTYWMWASNLPLNE